MTSKSLIDFYKHNQGKVSDKWTSNLEKYESLFSPLRDKAISLFEIGIQNGGSLEIWSKYFLKAKVFVGCDIDKKCSNLVYQDSRINLVIGDANQKKIQEDIIKKGRSFDIVIDDGSHRSSDIIKSFVNYFPHVADNGLYIIEDLHCSYWEDFEGGLFAPYSSMMFFKYLTDLINYEHWGVSKSYTDILEGFNHQYDLKLKQDVLKNISSIEFLNSMCIIRKSSRKTPELGLRVIGGKDATILDVRKFNSTESIPPSQINNVFSQRIRPPAEEVIELNKETEQQAKTINILNQNLNTVNEHVIKLNKETEQQAKTINILNQNLSTVNKHVYDLLVLQLKPSARLGRYIGRITKKFFPVNTIRRSILQAIIDLADRIYRHGFFTALRMGKTKAANSNVVEENIILLKKNISLQQSFSSWISVYEPNKEELEQQRLASHPYNSKEPLFSIILPVYKVNASVLNATITSVLNQTWQNWEACISYSDLENFENLALLERLEKEDKRLKICSVHRNGGISYNSNVALKYAKGEFIALLDHDDELTPWALYDMAKRIVEVPDADFLYSDKDSINSDGTCRLNPLFKPSWSPEMMFSVNYLTHLNVMRRSIVQKVGGWNSETDGAQDWDIFFRVIEQSRRIERVIGIHYHWRIIEGSTSTGIDAKPYALKSQLRTLDLRLKRLGLDATILSDMESGYHIKWQLDHRSKIDVILHGKISNFELVIKLLAGQQNNLLSSVTVLWPDDKQPPDRPSQLPCDVHFTVILTQQGKKTDAIENAFAAGNSPAILLLDLAVINLSMHFLHELTGWVLKHPEVGFASALVLLNDGTVVEAGRVVGKDNLTQPLFRGMSIWNYGPLGGPRWYRNVSAAGDTAIAFKRDKLQLSKSVGLSWDETIVKICTNFRISGLRGVIIPHASVYIEQMPRLTTTWHDSMRNDPYFHTAFKSVVPLLFNTERA
jgi:hypothetical protein